MTSIVKPSNSNYLSSQVSQYVAENYPQFLEFFQAYYDWLDTVSPRNFENIIDLDNCPEQFIQYYLAMYNPIGQNLTGNSAAHSLANIRKFYATKGSAVSFTLMFYMLFGDNVNIIYPSTQIFRASASSWIQQKSIFVNFTSGDPYLLTDTIATVTYLGVNYSVGITGIALMQDNLYELFIDTGYNIPNNAFEQSTLSSKLGHSGTIVGTVDGTISNGLSNHTTKITVAGSGFQVGEIFYIYPIANSVPSIIKITQISSVGGIVSFEVIKFGYGYGYTQPFNAVIYPSNGIISTSGTSNALSDNTYVNTESGYAYTSDYWSIDVSSGYAPSTYSGNILSSFSSLPPPNSSDTLNFASITFDITSMALYPGQFTSANGMLSDSASVLQDSYYYQQFSYVLRSGHAQSEYDAYVKAYLHPAGMQRFSIYNIETSSKMVNNSVVVNMRNFEVNLNDTNVTDDNMVMGLAYAYADNIIATESLSMDITITINDSTTTTDSISTNIGMLLADSTTSTDITNIQDDIVLNDSVTLDDNMTAYVNFSVEFNDSNTMSDYTLLSANAIAGLAIAGEAIAGVN